jgi:hypothetical protein
VKPEVKPEPEAELVEQEASGEPTDVPVSLTVPEFVDAKQVTEERQGYVNDFAQLAPQIGLSGEAAQDLVNLVVDCAVTLPYSAPDQHTTPEDAISALGQLYGEATAKDLIARAQKYTAGSEKLKDYLDRTGLGNDVGVLTALALAGSGWLALPPKEAAGATKRLMASPEFARGDKLTLVKLQMLSRLAERGEGQQPTPQATVELKRLESNLEVSREALKQQAVALVAKSKKGDMSPEDRAEFMELTRRISS